MRTVAAVPVQNRLEFIDKIVNVLKLTIDGSEPDKRDLIEISQSIEDELTNTARGNFAFTVFVDRRFDIAHKAINLLRTDGTFVARLFDAGPDLFPIERDAGSVLLDHSDRGLFNPFVRCETTLAAQTFTSASDGKILTVA